MVEVKLTQTFFLQQFDIPNKLFAVLELGHCPEAQNLRLKVRIITDTCFFFIFFDFGGFEFHVLHSEQFI